MPALRSDQTRVQPGRARRHAADAVVEQKFFAHGKRRISADTALRLARYFGTTDLFWINLQNRYELEVEKDALGDSLDSIQPLQSA